MNVPIRWLADNRDGVIGLDNRRGFRQGPASVIMRTADRLQNNLLPALLISRLKAPGPCVLCHAMISAPWAVPPDRNP